MDKISIIVPVYNSEKHIEQCVDSLLDQTHSNIEIILIDDGSTDRSGEICSMYAEKDARVIYKYQENQGSSAARNAGLDSSTGDWITFVDADDWVDKRMCEIALSKAKEAGADIVLWSYFTHFPNEVRKSKLVKGGSRNLTPERNELELKTISQYYGGISQGSAISAGSSWCKLYKRNLIFDNNIRFTLGLIRAQDTVFSLEAFELAEKIVFINEYLYNYRKSPSGITSGTKYIKDCKTPFTMLLESYKSFIKRYNKGEEFQVAINLRVIQVLMWYFKHDFFNDKNKKKFRVRRREILDLIKGEPYRQALSQVKLKWLPRSLRVKVIILRLRAVLLFAMLSRFI